MSKKHTILNQLLVTAAITSSSVLLTGCGVTLDSEKTDASVVRQEKAEAEAVIQESAKVEQQVAQAETDVIRAEIKAEELQKIANDTQRPEDKAAAAAAKTEEEDAKRRLDAVKALQHAWRARLGKEKVEALRAELADQRIVELSVFEQGDLSVVQPLDDEAKKRLSDQILRVVKDRKIEDKKAQIYNVFIANTRNKGNDAESIADLIRNDPHGLGQADRLPAAINQWIDALLSNPAISLYQRLYPSWSEALLNKPATGDNSYGLTAPQIARAAAKLADAAIIRSIFGEIGLPAPEAHTIGGMPDPIVIFINSSSDDIKTAVINARSDADYIGLVTKLGSDPVMQTLVPNTHRLRFLKVLRAKAIEEGMKEAPAAGLGLSAGIIRDLSGSHSLRTARTALTGQVDTRALALNGVQGTQVDLGLPLFVQLKGSVDSGKSTDATTGSVAYRLGNTVIGALQAYANSGQGFGLEGRQLETSVVASHSVGNVFAEAQLGAVSANNVHNSDWSGFRSQFTVGYDAQFISPFIQVAHRQLDRNATYSLNDTAAYVGLDMEVAAFTTDTYRIDTRLLTKVGIGSKDWSHGANAVGSTSGFEGSVEWSASLTLNSGVGFNTNLGLDTTAGSSAKFSVSVER